MGHYASEMGYERSDAYNYQAVNNLGFKSTSGGIAGTLKTCPRCFSVVEGQHAEAHWWSTHQKVSYFALSSGGDFTFLSYIGDDEEKAARYADLMPMDIVYSDVVDR